MKVEDLTLGHIGHHVRITTETLTVEGNLVYFTPVTETIHEPTLTDPNRIWAVLTGAEIHIGNNIIHVSRHAVAEVLDGEPA